MKYDNEDRLHFGAKQRLTHLRPNEFIHPNADINHDCVHIGYDVYIYQYATIGYDGFSQTRTSSGYLPDIPHTGRVNIGNRVTIFQHVNIDRGTADDNVTVIGDDCKIDHFVHVAHNVELGNRTRVVAGTMVLGSCHIGNDVWIGPNSVIRDKVKVADGCFIGSASNVVRDITEPYTMWVGNPARKIREGIENMPHLGVGT